MNKIIVEKKEEMITIKFVNKVIEVHEKSTDWNTKGINDFLLYIVGHMNKTEDLEFEKIPLDSDDSQLEIICNLFEKFINEINK